VPSFLDGLVFDGTTYQELRKCTCVLFSTIKLKKVDFCCGQVVCIGVYVSPFSVCKPLDQYFMFVVPFIIIYSMK
jgi:hypothetical protein